MRICKSLFSYARQLVTILIVFLYITPETPVYGSSIVTAEAGGHSFKIVGFHLDLRIQVMKPEALYALADELAGFGFNTLIMEWEGTFPYTSHPLIPNRYAYTKEEISDFIAYCGELGIDVIPLQQSFGHVEYILRHYRYADLREDQKDVSQVCPLEQVLNQRLFTDLFTEMASVHPSEYFHIGGDETYLLGHCDQCSVFADTYGKSKLYVDHIRMMCEIVIGLGKKPVLWADIALKHPEALSELPEETIFIDWNYGWKLNHFGDVEALANSGFEVWGAPSLRSSPDNYYLSTWEKHFGNFRDFIPAGKELGYSGMILTSWSTSGRYSPIYEHRWKIVDLVPIRRVYPLTGYRISIAAFIEAMNSTGTLDQKSFIADYCKERFGFNEQQAQLFWTAMTTTPFLVDNGNVLYKDPWSISMLLDSTSNALKTLRDLTPAKNKDEFEHFRLMMEIRGNYLAYKYIEAKVNAASFGPGNLSQVLAQLKEIIGRGTQISNKFIRLNIDAYYRSELEDENNNRNLPAILLYRRLSRQR